MWSVCSKMLDILISKYWTLKCTIIWFMWWKGLLNDVYIKKKRGPNTEPWGTSLVGSCSGSCSKFKKTVFGQSAFSVRASERWNLIPVYIRECTTLSIFKTTLIVWLKENQICDHWFYFLFNGVWCDILCVVCIVLVLIEYCNVVTTSCPGTANFGTTLLLCIVPV